MIGFLQGVIIDQDEISPEARLTVLVGDIGYLIRMNIVEARALDTGNDVRLWIHQRFSETANELFGFIDVHTRRIFLKLLDINGVGPKLALTLSGSWDLIARGDVAALKSLPGVGDKTARRILADLAIDAGLTLPARPAAAPPKPVIQSDLHNTATFALKALGYKEPDIRKTIERVVLAHPDLTEETAFVKKAIQLSAQGR